jgi:hypothetical protein
MRPRTRYAARQHPTASHWRGWALEIVLGHVNLTGGIAKRPEVAVIGAIRLAFRQTVHRRRRRGRTRRHSGSRRRQRHRSRTGIRRRENRLRLLSMLRCIITLAGLSQIFFEGLFVSSNGSLSLCSSFLT